MVVKILYHGQIRFYFDVCRVYYDRGVSLVFTDGSTIDIPSRKIDLMAVYYDD